MIVLVKFYDEKQIFKKVKCSLNDMYTYYRHVVQHKTDGCVSNTLRNVPYLLGCKYIDVHYNGGNCELASEYVSLCLSERERYRLSD